MTFGRKNLITWQYMHSFQPVVSIVTVNTNKRDKLRGALLELALW